MSGCIIGLYGYQRSGKTMLAYLLADMFRKKGCDCYSNMDVDEWTKISSLDELPINKNPKVLLLDECYYFLDSRAWNDNTQSSLFFNTIGKQNICLLLTCPTPDMVEKRLRNQQNYIFLVKSDKNNIYYKVFDVQRKREKLFTINKNHELYDSLHYDHEQIPDFIDTRLDKFLAKFGKIKNNNNDFNFGGYIKL